MLNERTDFERLRCEMLELLLAARGEWVPFKRIALKLRADPDVAHVLVALANQEPNLFCNSKDHVVRLSLDGIHEAQRVGTGALAAPQLAARAVHKYAARLKPHILPIRNVEPGQVVLGRFLHRLAVAASNDDLRLADDTPVTFKSKAGSSFYGKIAGVDPDETLVYVAFRDEILLADLPADLHVDTTSQWRNIWNRLELQKATPSLFEALQNGCGGGGLQSLNSLDLASQFEQLSAPWARLLWGPPGAGKTFCLARFVASLIDSDSSERVLVVAPSNVAVDAATLELVSALRSTAFGQRVMASRLVVRYGYSRNSRVLEQEELFGSVQLENLSKKIKETFDQISRLRSAGVAQERIAIEKAKIQQFQEEQRKLLTQHLASARVILTTLASLTTGKEELLSSRYGTVIVDEVSMVSSAQILLLSAYADRRFLLAGDPRQLAPICEWHNPSPPEDVQKWIAADPYEFIGLAKGDGLDKTIEAVDGRVARILSQRRCHPDIWAIAAPLYPNVETTIDERQLDPIRSATPVGGKSVVVFDVSAGSLADRVTVEATRDPDVLACEYESACMQVGKSWQNPPTATLAIDIAREAHANSPTAKIVIITPYRAQVRLIRGWLRDESNADPSLQNIETGTVHSFQGGEADIVIFDVVDGHPRQDLGHLLRGDAGVRLVNVATTRAKAKLFVIAHRAWFENRNIRSQNGLLDQILFRERTTLKVLGIRPNRPKQIGQPESRIEEALIEALLSRRPALPPHTLQHRICEEQGRIVSRADIAFVAHRVAVYCDGAKYHLVQHQWQKDLRQRRKLIALGWKPIAFSGAEILRDPKRCVEDIADLVCPHGTVESGNMYKPENLSNADPDLFNGGSS